MPSEEGESRYWSGGHTTNRLRYHLVFTPKYRRRVLHGRLVERLDELFRQACETRRWQIHELSIQPDHVHMMIQIWPKDRLSEVVQVLKGGTSYIVRQEFPALEEFLWGKSFWSDGYFAETIGSIDDEAMRKYIRNQ